MGLQDLAEKVKNCQKCRLSETRKNALPGEGNIKSRVLLIAQAPGEKEDKAGKMFVGPTGKVLNRLFKELGIEKDDIYMTNLVKCMLPDYRKPRQDEIQVCSKYLDKEIESVDPDILVPMGYYSTKYILKKYNISEIESKEDCQELYGNLLLSSSKKVYPVIHPTALLFKSTKRDKIKEQYSKIKVFLQECKWYQVCPMKSFLERGMLDRKWVELYCKGDWKSCVRYKKEERGEFHSDYMLPDGTIDEKLGRR